MTRKFGESKYANKYLEDRYGKIYNLTFDCNEELKNQLF